MLNASCSVRSATSRVFSLRTQATNQYPQTIMRLFILFLFAAVLTSPCKAQLANTREQKSATGTFYVSVDDMAKIFINGTKVFEANAGESRSPQVELKNEDRVVVQLENKVGTRRFMLVLASSDGETIVSFKHSDFKIVPDIDVTDFAPADFQKWSKFAKQEIRSGNAAHKLPIKSYSDWVWGDRDKCILAAVVTPQMFTQKPK
jgi:biopolymer transport protein ExbD